MGIRGHCGLGGPAPHTTGQLRGDIVSRSSRSIGGDTCGFRPAFSGSSDLGFPGSVCVGIQREVASRFSGTTTGAWTSSLLAVALNSAGVLVAFAGWMMAASVLLVAGIITAVYALRLFEPTRTACQDQGSSHELSSFRPLGLRLGFGCGAPWNLGRFSVRTRTVYGVHRGTL